MNEVARKWEPHREAVRHKFAAIQAPLRLTTSDLEIEAYDDVAYGHSLQRVSGTHVKGGSPLDHTVRVTDVYRKIDGTWLIVQEHISLPIERETLLPILH